jgi:predicted DNA-binding antitoxin AbrB/MazE fold protein
MTWKLPGRLGKLARSSGSLADLTACRKLRRATETLGPWTVCPAIAGRRHLEGPAMLAGGGPVEVILDVSGYFLRGGRAGGARATRTRSRRSAPGRPWAPAVREVQGQLPRVEARAGNLLEERVRAAAEADTLEREVTVTRTLEAVYEGGVLKPLEDPGLEEHQRVLLEIRTEPQEAMASTLEAWQQVYEGLSEEEIAEVEAIALDRGHFSREER